MPRRTKKDQQQPSPNKDSDVPPLRLEWRSPAELAENPRNWRTHPDTQLTALTDIISEVGWAGACLYNEQTGRLIDGHARRKVAHQQGTDRIPVLVGSWTEEQEQKILATLDPLAAMAEADAAKLDALLREVQTSSAAVADMLSKLAEEAGIIPDTTGQPQEAPDQTGQLTEKYQIIITCESEEEQSQLLERFAQEGLECRSLIS